MRKMAVGKLLRRKKFLNINEMAELLGVIKRSVCAFRAAKQIPEPYKMRDKSDGQIKVVWKTSELRRWIAQGCPDADTIQSKQKSAAAGRNISNKLLKRKKYLNADEMVKFLGVSKRTIWRFRMAKQIPAPHKIWDKSASRMKAVWKTDELRRWLKQDCPSEDTIKFAHKHPIHAAMLSNKHSRQRVLKMKDRIIKARRR